MVVIDVEGEYVRMNEANDRVDMNSILKSNFNLDPIGITDFQTFVPSSGDSEAASPIRFKVPISQLDISVIADIKEFSEPQFRMFERVVEEAQRRNPSTTGTSNRLGSLGTGSSTTTQPYTLQGLIDVLKTRHS